MIGPLGVSCPHCTSGIGEVCLGPSLPGKSAQSRRPLKFSSAHPQRIALAAVMSAGASGREARVAARYAVLTIQPKEIVPYLEIARLAVEDAGAVTVDRYRKIAPPAPEPVLVEAAQPELALE